jgi:hypothetical protein
VRNAIDQAQRQGAQKRGGDNVVGEACLQGANADDPGGGLDRFAGREPTPEFAAMVAEQYRKLRDALGDDALREVLDLRLQGYGRAEIAARQDCVERTVTRRLDVIRRIALEEDIV